jgi:hypothetical protein
MLILLRQLTSLPPPSPLRKFVFVSYRYSILLNWSPRRTTNAGWR